MPADDNTMLGGYLEAHQPDIEFSNELIERHKDDISGLKNAIDCGAGKGRVTKHVLLKHFKHVDLVEPSKVQRKKARKNVPEVRNFYYQTL